MGKKATLINIGGEGSPRWKVVDEKGTTRTTRRSSVLSAGSRCPATTSRSGNKKTNATVDNGFLHAVAVIMAAQSYCQGKRLYHDSTAEQILTAHQPTDVSKPMPWRTDHLHGTPQVSVPPTRPSAT
jgi:hypothetical protein